MISEGVGGTWGLTTAFGGATLDTVGGLGIALEIGGFNEGACFKSSFDPAIRNGSASGSINAGVNGAALIITGSRSKAFVGSGTGAAIGAGVGTGGMGGLSVGVCSINAFSFSSIGGVLFRRSVGLGPKIDSVAVSGIGKTSSCWDGSRCTGSTGISSWDEMSASFGTVTTSTTFNCTGGATGIIDNNVAATIRCKMPTLTSVL